jgi:nucleotide-binding universal stress UspA family protein
MEKFRKIFVAIDFSAGSDEALRQAHDRAAPGGKLAVCHVVPNELRSNLLFPHITRIAALKVPLDLKRVAESVSARVGEVTGRTQTEFDLIVDDGTPYAAIVTNAEKWGADLIAVGSRGTTAAGSHFGSVANKVIRYAHCPVLIARQSEGVGGIVAGTDFSDPALPALKAAADEARRTGEQLTIVHSLDVWSALSYPAMAFGGAPINLSVEQVHELESAVNERLNDALKGLGIRGQTRVTQGPAGNALIDISSLLKARLIVVGTIGRTGLRQALLGSVAETVAIGAPCSVLIVRLYEA